MIRPVGPAGSDLLIHAVALYLPVVAVLALALRSCPTRARLAGALLATAWNLPALLAVNLIAVRAGWWTFGGRTAMVTGVPVDLWLGWAVLWGAVPILATTQRLVRAAAVLLAVDLVLMPAGEPVVVLGSSWLVGEAIALATCLTPGLLLGRWTATNRHVGRRAALQVVAFGGILLFVLPSLIFTVTDESWQPLLRRPRWLLVAVACLMAPAIATALQAVREFADHGGTPVPLDPPASLVTTGPYAYVANPMQLGATLVLIGWGVLLTSMAVVAAAAMAAVFSMGLAAWSEGNQLRARFGDDWRRYRRHVRSWVPRWRPAVLAPAGRGRAFGAPAIVYVAESCGACSTVGRFIRRRRPLGLAVEAAEVSTQPLRRITYQSGRSRATGVAALARSLEHANLAWAVVGWIARLPLVQPVLQLITDAVGGGPRPSSEPALGSGPTCGGARPPGGEGACTGKDFTMPDDRPSAWTRALEEPPRRLTPDA